MNIIYLNPHDSLPETITNNKPISFLQTQYNAQIASLDGFKNYQIIIQEGSEIMAYALILIYPLALGYNQLYIPRGPLFFNNNVKVQTLFWQEIKKLARKEKAAFLVFEPDQNSSLDFTFHNNVVQIKPFHKERIPHQTVILDLSHSWEILLNQMKPKTRYNIRKAQKSGVTVKIINPLDHDFEQFFSHFFNLLTVTAARDNFYIHTRQHYRNIFNIYTDDHQPLLFVAEHEHDILGINLILNTKTETIYLHGASSNVKRNLMAPYLLQWEAIQYAQKQGSKTYDFWGISDIKPSWAGITRFKKGFGGNIIDYPPSQIVIFNPIIYNLYNLRNRIKR